MKISTKGRYALRMMLDLAEHQGDGYVALKDIAQRQGISKKYLEQIVPMLGRADVLRTTRGYQGGYRLARARAAAHAPPCPCGRGWSGSSAIISMASRCRICSSSRRRAPRTTTSSENSTLHKNLRQFKLPEVFRSGDPGHCCCASL